MQSEVKCKECGRENSLETKKGVVILGQRCVQCGEILSSGLSRRWFLGAALGAVTSAALPGDSPGITREHGEALLASLKSRRDVASALFTGEGWTMAEHQIMMAARSQGKTAHAAKLFGLSIEEVLVDREGIVIQ